jgi:hypothetical protein
MAKLPEGFQAETRKLKAEILREIAASPPTLEKPVVTQPVMVKKVVAPPKFDENAPPPPE